MPNLNKVMLIGHLTRDPELTYTPSNTAICKFGIATSRTWKSPQGESQKETCFVDCTNFAKQAEILNQYVKKGDPLFIEGHLKLDQWQDKQTGVNRSKLSVIVDKFEFLKPRDQGQPQANAPSSGSVYENTHKPVGEDDIPF